MERLGPSRPKALIIRIDRRGAVDDGSVNSAGSVNGFVLRFLFGSVNGAGSVNDGSGSVNIGSGSVNIGSGSDNDGAVNFGSVNGAGSVTGSVNIGSGRGSGPCPDSGCGSGSCPDDVGANMAQRIWRWLLYC